MRSSDWYFLRLHLTEAFQDSVASLAAAARRLWRKREPDAPLAGVREPRPPRWPRRSASVALVEPD